MKMRVAAINESSYVDGPGRRAVLFLQGCLNECPGCQNRHLWALDGGVEMSTDEVAARLLDTGLPITISGGEPMLQAEALAEMLGHINVQDPKREIVVYTGLVIEDIFEWRDFWPEMIEVLYLADVLVDGPYMAELDHDGMQWRGSSNQRVIDLGESIIIDLVEERLWLGEIVTLDWDTPALTITEDGIVGAKGVIEQLFGDAQAELTRMCGQTVE